MSANNASMTFSGDSSAAQSAVLQIGAQIKDLVGELRKMTAEGRKGAGEYSGAWKKANRETTNEYAKAMAEWQKGEKNRLADVEKNARRISDYQGKIVMEEMARRIQMSEMTQHLENESLAKTKMMSEAKKAAIIKSVQETNAQIERTEAAAMDRRIKNSAIAKEIANKEAQSAIAAAIKENAERDALEEAFVASSRKRVGQRLAAEVAANQATVAAAIKENAERDALEEAFVASSRKRVGQRLAAEVAANQATVAAAIKENAERDALEEAFVASSRKRVGQRLAAEVEAEQSANAQIVKDEIELNDILLKLAIEAGEADMKFELNRAKNAELANAQIQKDQMQLKAQTDAINAKTFSTYSDYNQRRLQAQQQLNAMLWKEEQEQAVRVETVHARTLRGGMGRGWSAPAGGGAAGTAAAVAGVVAQSGKLGQSNRVLQQGMTQLSFAADDVMQTFQTMGASGAIRSAGNNISTFITMINPLYGILATVGIGALAFWVKGWENASKAVDETAKKTKEAIETYKKVMEDLRDEIAKIRGDTKAPVFDVDEMKKFDSALEAEKKKLGEMEREYRDARSPTGGAFKRGLVRLWDDDAYKESDKKEKAAIEEQKKRVKTVEEDKQKFKDMTRVRDAAERKAFAAKELDDEFELYKKKIGGRIKEGLGIEKMQKRGTSISARMAEINKATQEETETIGRRKDIGPSTMEGLKIAADDRRDKLIEEQTKALKENTEAVDRAKSLTAVEIFEMLDAVENAKAAATAAAPVFAPVGRNANVEVP